ncbi:MAG: PLP-dependent aminotransferase family protein [Actinomycetaceae bacterium]|nr:PLP-dependent aminotransferase family protein [Actinomycetaceae bacterium]
MGRQVTGMDQWADMYSQRATHLRESEIRALFAVVSRPEVVSLAGGMPNIKDLPIARLAESAKQLILSHGPQAMQYGSGQGWGPLREQIGNVMSYEGSNPNPDNVVISTGSQQALDYVTQIFINPGDVIVAEAPSYVGALGVFAAYQADVVHVPLDEDGLIPQALEETLADLKKVGKRVKFLYTVPNFHNPGGVTMSLERRPQIVEICRRHHVLVLEDNPYGLLGFHSEPIPSLHSLAPDTVIYLGSFSKMFAPGFRIGWAVAPPAIRQKLVLASESALLSPSMVGQMAISGYLSDYNWYGQVKAFQGMYEERCQAMMDALQEYLPDCTWTKPTGGFYTWVTVPEGIDTKEMLPRAVTGQVAYTSGTAFYADGQGRQNIRLSYCYPEPDVIREGVRRLSIVMNREKELVELFGPSPKTSPEKK